VHAQFFPFGDETAPNMIEVRHHLRFSDAQTAGQLCGA
jgi:hypothetical protein